MDPNDAWMLDAASGLQLSAEASFLVLCAFLYRRARQARSLVTIANWFLLPPVIFLAAAILNRWAGESASLMPLLMSIGTQAVVKELCPSHDTQTNPVQTSIPTQPRRPPRREPSAQSTPLTRAAEQRPARGMGL